MNRALIFLVLLIFVGSLNAFIGEGISNVFTITGTPVDESILPPDAQNTWMRPASPNPFRSGDQARVNLNVKTGETATCGIYNLSGQLVRSQTYFPGSHSFVWDGRDPQGNICGSGIYLLRLQSPSHSSSARLVLLK
ncbi:MAG: FlgD immunoglobulin-like domain containing protein [Candidatus Cloacimonetes bacterium]|nr:FlgD immunoglobulin-like domain containing protein [Candidatus Cloacimonadota bacterium]